MRGCSFLQFEQFGGLGNDDNIGWEYMMIIHDDNIWWQYMMIIYDDNLWWSYMMITYDYHIWQSYMMIINDHHHICHLGSSGSHLGSSGRHLGVIWDPFGIHLGSIWRHLGGWRLKRHLEARSHMMCLTLEQNATVPLKLQFYEVFLRVPPIMTAYLQQHLLPGSVPDPGDSSRALYQDRENPIS